MAEDRTLRQRLLKRLETPWWRTWGIAILLCVIGLVVTAQFLPPPLPDVVRIATGPEGGGYDAFGEALARELAQDDFEVELVRTSGSIENLARLEERRVDLALVQGGTVPEPPGGLRTLASVFFEPLWLFRRRDVEIELLSDLEGVRVSIGAEGSGTRPLVTTLLAANGIDASEVETAKLGGAEGAEALLAGELDALFVVVSPEADYLAGLLDSAGVVLHDWARNESYARRWPFLHAVELSPGLLDLEKDVPPEPVRLVAPAAALVMHEETHRGLVLPVIEAATRVLRRGSVLSEPGTFPSKRYADAPVDEDAARYFERGPSFLYRIFPYPAARVIDRLKIFLIPLLTLLLPLFRVAPPLYRWRMRSRIYRWYRILRESDGALNDQEGADLEREVAKLDALEREITSVDVPLSFTDELYHLHMHIGYVRDKLESRIARS